MNLRKCKGRGSITMGIPDIEKDKDILQQKDIDSFRKELGDLLEKMNDNQIRNYLTISVTRRIVYLNKYFSENLRKVDYSRYLNSILVSIGYNYIILFSDDARDLDHYRTCAIDCALALDLDLARALASALASAIDLDNYRALARGLNLDRARARDRALDLARARVLARARALDFALDLALDLALDQGLIIKDAETVLNESNAFSYNAKLFKRYEDCCSAFLTVLRDLNGKYWAEWFEKLNKNNFRLDPKDIEAILSLNENQFRQTIEQTSDYLLDFIRNNADSDEIRLMILGDKGGGKTSFARRFVELGAAMPSEDESTKGINFSEFLYSKISADVGLKDIDKNTKRDVTIKIWDFAGHEVTHAAHKFFLSKRCVYVIVCQARQEDSFEVSKIEYWLEHIRDYAEGENQTVFVLINMFDDNKPSVNEESIRKNYGEYKLVFRYLNIKKDDKKDGKLDEFRHELIEFILSADTKIPANYKKIQERIYSKFENKNYIEKVEVEEIIIDENSKDKGSKNYDIILKNLNDWGYCFWFSEILEVKTIVINPRWITGAVYKIINWVQNSSCMNASIEKSDFEKALRETEENKLFFPKDKDDDIFKIMKHFGLAYSEDGNTLVIPYCLNDSYPDNETGLKYDSRDSVQVDFCIQTLANVPSPEFPKDTIPLFIVKNYKLIHKVKEKSMVSRYRAMFEGPNGSIAEIWRFSNETRRICITVKGNDFDTNIDYLSTLANCLSNKILSEHKRFQKQKPEILYLATDVNGKQIQLSIEDTRKLGIELIAKLKNIEFSKEERDKSTKVSRAISNVTTINNNYYLERVGTMNNKNQFMIGNENSQMFNAESGAAIAIDGSIAAVINKGVKSQELVELIAEVRKNIGELSEDMQNKVNGILKAMEDEAVKDEPNKWSLESFSNSLSDIKKALPAGLLCNAITEVVKYMFNYLKNVVIP